MDIGGKTLLEVLIATNNDHRALLRKTGGQRGYAVVSLAVVRNFKIQAQGRYHALNGRHLAQQVFWRGIAIGLVERKDIMPEILALAVFDKKKVTRSFFAQDAQQHTGDHNQSIGGKTVRALHVSVGEKTPIDKGRAVHQKDGFSGKIKTLF